MASEDEKIPVATTSVIATAAGQTKNRLNGMATIQDDDERLLAQIGYKQV
jgi:hypothetical protein